MRYPTTRALSTLGLSTLGLSTLGLSTLLLLAACGDDSLTSVELATLNAPGAHTVVTDAPVYTLRRASGAYVALATALYVNRTGRPVYYRRCRVGDNQGPMYDYRRTGRDSTRRLFTDQVWACVGGVPTGMILPGENVTVQVRLGADDQPRMQPPLEPEDLVGTMRIELALCAAPSPDSDHCVPVPQPQRQSNAFLVRY